MNALLHWLGFPILRNCFVCCVSFPGFFNWRIRSCPRWIYSVDPFTRRVENQEWRFCLWLCYFAHWPRSQILLSSWICWISIVFLGSHFTIQHITSLLFQIFHSLSLGKHLRAIDTNRSFNLKSSVVLSFNPKSSVVLSSRLFPVQAICFQVGSFFIWRRGVYVIFMKLKLSLPLHHLDRVHLQPITRWRPYIWTLIPMHWIKTMQNQTDAVCNSHAYYTWGPNSHTVRSWILQGWINGGDWEKIDEPLWIVWSERSWWMSLSSPSANRAESAGQSLLGVLQLWNLRRVGRTNKLNLVSQRMFLLLEELSWNHILARRLALRNVFSGSVGQ
jgi:hypothetical protein